jgi:hypothetical protein
VRKQTTEVSGNQTPEACSLLSGVSRRQARASPIPAPYYVCVRPRGTTRNFLTVFHRFRHSVSTKKICHRLQGYSKFGQYSLHSGIFFQKLICEQNSKQGPPENLKPKHNFLLIFPPLLLPTASNKLFCCPQIVYGGYHLSSSCTLCFCKLHGSDGKGIVGPGLGRLSGYPIGQSYNLVGCGTSAQH